MANGDVTYVQVEEFIQLSSPLPETSETSISQADVNQICEYVNAEVNLVLVELGFVLPLSPDPSDGVTWVQFTKTLAASAYTLLGINAQAGDEGIVEQANQLLTRYQNRTTQLIESGGELIGGLESTITLRPSRVPVALMETTSDEIRKSIVRRKLRFEQLVRAERYENEQYLADHMPDEWSGLIRGV